MASWRRLACLATLAALAAAPDAAGQYYAVPGYYPRQRPQGGRCEARLPGTFGPRTVICGLARPRLLGRPCTCPAPTFVPGAFLRGRVIR